ncbi:FAD binding domain-containing protein [Rhodobacteraceae bacterium DSL-40]|uniref:xanthine dehydrogenase small subunit n=1 Tax=Amaricoccus sp. B4 TaxID=3368557 RepID=UPI000DADEAFD
MAVLRFRLNGRPVEIPDPAPTQTLLDWLREEKALTGTKEGCNEGDCGACTVMVTGPSGPRALNACILFLPQIEGLSVRTVEGLAGENGLHPVQEAMVEHHGSQCGFCTPGIVMSLAVAQMQGRQDWDDVLAGNLCRCTGYAPILRAAEAASALSSPALDPQEVSPPRQDLDDFADWYADHPGAVLVGGATDVGLWVTKALRELPEVAFLSQVAGLDRIEETPDGLRIGAMVDMERLRGAVAPHYADLAEMLRRFASVQVRNAATIGGNIANGSPIGDSPPALIALGARLTLRRAAVRREIPLEDFFLDYGKQDRAPGEFVESVFIPAQPDRLRCYKVSKRFDQDISAVCGCFALTIESGGIVAARIAFGGVAATPKRARAVETFLVGKPWSEATIRSAQPIFAEDYSPISDMRASAAYRARLCGNLLMRYFLETEGATAIRLAGEALA